MGRVQVIEQLGTAIDKAVEPRRKRGAGAAQQLSDANRPALLSLGVGMSSLLHKFGINVRHIGMCSLYARSLL